MPPDAKQIVFPRTPKRPVLFLKSMPKGGVDTGPVFVLTDAMAARYDADPSVLDALMKQCRELGLNDMEGNVEIRHPKGYTLGLWQGMLSTMDPSWAAPDVAGVTKQKP